MRNNPAPLPPVLTNFTIHDPYAFPGSYRKAQLHLHTSQSTDVLEKRPVGETLAAYQQAGYQFVVITDHDRVTEFSNLNSPSFLVIPGEEVTMPFLFWPLGKHLVRFPSVPKGGPVSTAKSVMMPAHPNWCGNLESGRWLLSDLLELPELFLVEIYNHHSDHRLDLDLWHQLLQKKGSSQPVWGVAVDDSDNGRDLDRGWIMVKTKTVTLDDFLQALQHGAFYATNGPAVTFGVEEGGIRVETDTISQISFINATKRIIKIAEDQSAFFRPCGDEGFVRVEVRQNDRTAWSQPFFLKI